MDVLGSFHPVVREWFARRFHDGPMPSQVEGWPRIAEGRDVLIAAPTGSGKTLAAFLVCIDRLLRAGGDAELTDAVSTGLRFRALAVTTCRFPNRALAEVSLPVRNTPSQPTNALKKGNTPPVAARDSPSVDVIPE